ncbi:hypothetical protein LEP1GSC021_3866 [Leptospira noguchii str. 1993005606]|uniref:Uncharacterized protein n=2 Tax=Leptospira noguchii TaxID=28182 RepID=M6YHN6_9LEPT|nr:hypothetical protein [Leptospira noguchii]EMN02780.1 hypothetical protein LEP1GSC035_2078 [Leptospira noguchii str. 2007001578]EMO89119.1 hypothetical protein LEP1GSC024_4927 [Leptospira noguchii str. 2001034031]EPE85472.1 hypothetical protein LEP1GSC021_3866 [Leptospira noguchii str. 1993005606]
MKIGGEYRVQLGIPRDESLYYIGHGQLESAPASTSVLHVISHELGHVAEFKSEAIRDRAEIRSLNMKIHYEFRNGKLVAVAGETEVITAKKPEETSHKSNEISKQDSWKEKDFPKKEETSKIRSEDREKQILSEIRRIESELKIFETKKNAEEKKEFDSIRKTELEEKKRKLEMVLSQEKLKAVLKDTMDTFRELISNQTRMSLKIFNTNVSDKLGNFLDAKV